MNLVNSKDIVADRVREIQALAAATGRPSRSSPQRRALAAWAGARILARPQRLLKTVEEV